MRLILHIGTEKTGTTSLQAWAAEYRDQLAQQGVWYPLSLGKFNHRSLSFFGRTADDPDDGMREAGLTTDAALRLRIGELRHQFANEHGRSLARGCTTALISSEHLHSRLRDDQEVGRVADFIKPFFDSITVMIHLRPQVDMALSLASTAARRGHQIGRRFFDRIAADNPYYNYDTLVALWENAFGAENVVLIPFKQQPSFADALAPRIGLDLDTLPPVERVNEALDVGTFGLVNAFRGRDLNTADPSALLSHLCIEDLPVIHKLELGEKMNRSVGDKFKASNKALAKRRSDITYEDLKPKPPKNKDGNFHHLESVDFLAKQFTQLINNHAAELAQERSKTHLAEMRLTLAMGNREQSKFQATEVLMNLAIANNHERYQSYVSAQIDRLAALIASDGPRTDQGQHIAIIGGDHIVSLRVAHQQNPDLWPEAQIDFIKLPAAANRGFADPQLGNIFTGTDTGAYAFGWNGLVELNRYDLVVFHGLTVKWDALAQDPAVIPLTGYEKLKKVMRFLKVPVIVSAAPAPFHGAYKNKGLSDLPDLVARNDMEALATEMAARCAKEAIIFVGQPSDTLFEKGFTREKYNAVREPDPQKLHAARFLSTQLATGSAYGQEVLPHLAAAAQVDTDRVAKADYLFHHHRIRLEQLIPLLKARIVTEIPQNHNAPAIPRRLIQFWDKDPDEDVQKLLGANKKWAADNNVTYEFFDEKTARDWMAAHAPNAVYAVQAYDACFHPAMKSDLFRLAKLIVDGGFYLDADNVMNDASKALFMATGDLYFFNHDQRRLFNGMIAAIPHSPVIQRAYDYACYNLNGPIGPGINIGELTGPFVLSLAAGEIVASGQPYGGHFIFRQDQYDLFPTGQEYLGHQLDYKTDDRAWQTSQADARASAAKQRCIEMGGDVDAYLEMSRQILLFDGQIQDIEEIGEKYWDKLKQSDRCLDMRVKGLRRIGDLARARQIAQDLYAEGTEGPALLRLISHYRMREGNFEAALALAQKAIAHNPNDANNHISLLESYIEMKDYEHALPLLDDCKERFPRNPRFRQMKKRVTEEMKAQNA